MWTGFDYRGEPTPNHWPSASSFFGCMDLCGFPKAAFYIHQAQWIESRPVLHLIPHWNWPDKLGQPVKVMALTNAETVALFLNGQATRRETGGQIRARFVGRALRARQTGSRGEKGWSRGCTHVRRNHRRSDGFANSPQTSPALAGDGCDAQPVTVAAVDAQGRLVSTANFPVEFELAGPGAIIGLGNGDPEFARAGEGQPPQHLQRFGAGHRAKPSGENRPAGLARDIRRAPACVRHDQHAVRADAPRSCQFRRRPSRWGKWRMSPVSAAAPDANQEIPDSDQNSWTQIQPGKPQPLTGGNFAVLRIKFTPRATERKAGGTLTFRSPRRTS